MGKRALLFLLSSMFIIIGCKKETGEEFWGEEGVEAVGKEKFGGDFPALEETDEFEGNVETRGDYNIKGRFKGSIIADGMIVIERTGYVECDSIVALDIIVQGYVKGKLKAIGKIQVDTTGVVVGATNCRYLIVNGGAIFHGPAEMPDYKGGYGGYDTKTKTQTKRR